MGARTTAVLFLFVRYAKCRFATLHANTDIERTCPSDEAVPCIGDQPLGDKEELGPVDGVLQKLGELELEEQEVEAVDLREVPVHLLASAFSPRDRDLCKERVRPTYTTLLLVLHEALGSVIELQLEVCKSRLETHKV